MVLSRNDVLKKIRKGHDLLVKHVEGKLAWSMIEEDIRHHWIRVQIARHEGVYPFVFSAMEGVTLEYLSGILGRDGPI